MATDKENTTRVHRPPLSSTFTPAPQAPSAATPVGTSTRGGSGIKPPTDFRSPLKQRSKNTTVAGSRAQKQLRPRTRSRDVPSSTATPRAGTADKRKSPNGELNTRPTKTRRSAAKQASAPRGATSTRRSTRASTRAATSRSTSRSSRTSSRRGAASSSSSSTPATTPSRRRRTRAATNAVVEAPPAAEEVDMEVDGETEGDAVAIAGGVLAAAREAFETDIDFDEVMTISTEKRAAPREKLKQLRPQIKKVKSALAGLVAQRDAFLKKCAKIDAKVQQQMSEVGSEADTLRSSVTELNTQVAALQQKVAVLETTNEMLRQRKDELRSEIPQLSEAKRRLSSELDSCRATIQSTQREIREQMMEVARLNQELSAAQSSRDTLQVQMDEATKDAASKQQTMKDEHDKEVEGLRMAHDERIKEMQERCSELSDKVAALETQREDATRAASTTQGDLKAMTLERDSMLREKDTLQASVVRLETELSMTKKSLEEARTRMDQTVQALVAATSAHDSRQDQLSRERQQLQDRIQTMQTEQDRLLRSESDLKSELKDKQHMITNLEARAADLAAKLEDFEQRFTASQATVEACNAEIATLKQSLEEMTGKAAEAEAGLTEAQTKLTSLEHKEEVWSKERELMEHQNKELITKNKEANDNLSSLREELATVKDSAGASKQAQFSKLCEVSKEAAQLRVQMTNMQELREELEAMKAKNATLTSKLFDNEMVRRKLHNTIQELRGNIRVFVRVRPILGSDTQEAAENGTEEAGEPTEVVRCSADATRVAVVPNASARKAKSQYGFTFDHVFGQNTTQQEVFDEVSELVQSALDGYNVCLFSYGQTGSGKTHTMQGMPGADTEGLIPRSIKKIVAVTRAAAAHNWNYTLEASFLEIYNESLQDLLRDESSNHKATLSVHLDADGTVDVHNLTRVKVTDGDSIHELMAKAATMRSVGATSMNARSSRSHSVFTLRIRGTNKARGVVVNGTLNLVDLAGSERLSRSKAEGARLKETQSINKSLSCLSDVFTSLSNNSSHIPFRNSKLTFLLQNCFKGDGKTLMMVNLSPHASSTNESLCSLRFASTVNQVHMGKAKRKVQSLKDDATGSASSSTGAGAGAGAGAGSSTSSKRPASASSRLMSGTASSRRRTKPGASAKGSKRQRRSGWN